MPEPQPARAPESWTATGRERPVFLDEEGRRRRWVLLGGSLAGAVSACWLAALVVGAIGFSTLPSVADRAPLSGSRAVPYARRVAARHAGAAGHVSTLERASELAAVSRGLSAAP